MPLWEPDRFHIAEHVLASKGKGKQKLEQGFKWNSLLFPDIALPEQFAKRMIVKELAETVHTATASASSVPNVIAAAAALAAQTAFLSYGITS